MRSSCFCTVVLFFFKIIFKHRINIIRLFIYVIIIISLLLVFELDDKLTYSMLFLQSSRYKNPLSKGPKMDMPQVYWRFDQQNNTTWTSTAKLIALRKK